MASLLRPPRVCLATALILLSASLTGAQTPESPRHNLAAALEALIATGQTEHTTHDAGEWLQLAVSDAINRGDREIERLAVRAAFPLRAHITRPVSSTDDLPSLEINTHSVLSVPRPIGYSAQVLVSLDGGDFFQARGVRSGNNQGWRVDTGLGRAAGLPGVHSLRLRAHLTFGDPARDARASWTEVRDLPQLFYAVYDVTAQAAAGSLDSRAFVYGPASVATRELDSALGDEPFAIWLASVLSARRTRTDPPHPDWLSHYCSERTSEAGVAPEPAAICSVVYFQVRGHIGKIWFRTADVRITDAGVTWERVTPPRFEGFVIAESAPESQRLSMLPSVLDTDPALRPVGDVAISPDDIVAAPSDPQAGAPFSVTITVRNQGSGDLFKVAVHVALVTSPTEKGASRQFVVDVPAQGSAAIKLEGVFPLGYGAVVAHALQTTEHSPFENWTPDPTPEDACAFRIVNRRAAPPRYLESLGDTSLCRGK